MKKILLAMLGSIVMQPMLAQDKQQSGVFNRWYIGAQYGVNTKTTHNDDYLGNINASAGLRFGYDITPAFGFMVEGTAFFGDVKFGASRCFVKALNGDVLAVINLSNLFFPITGERHLFEARIFGGAGTNYIFGYPLPENNFDLISKFGLDLGINLGSRKQWYIYLQPAINYNLDHYSRTQYNINYSALQASIGINYRFPWGKKMLREQVIPQVVYIEPVIQPTKETTEEPTKQSTKKQSANQSAKKEPTKQSAKSATKDVAASSTLVLPQRTYIVRYLRPDEVLPIMRPTVPASAFNKTYTVKYLEPQQKEIAAAEQTAPAVTEPKKQAYAAAKRENGAATQNQPAVAKNEMPALAKNETPAVAKKETPVVAQVETVKKPAATTTAGRQMKSIAEVVSYMKSHPKSSVVISGSKAKDAGLQLVRRYNINSSRITTSEGSDKLTFMVN